jgi:uncharacterized membrane-anchored protein YjiN (DUF445 family)
MHALDAPPPPDDSLPSRLRDIRRMRRVATGLLALVTALFVGSLIFEERLPQLAPLRAFAEAAMIGAIADWFAVVALFRHPFGIPIPHTAVIPGNHARIAAAIGRFVANNLLASAAMAQRLEELDPSGRLARWLAQPQTSQTIARRVAESLPPIMGSIGEDRLRGTVGAALRKGVDLVVTPGRMAGVLSFAAEQNYHQSLLDVALDAVRDFVGRHEPFIRRKVAERCGEWMPLWVESRLADAVIKGIDEVLRDLRKPGHPWRLELDSTLRGFTETMSSSADFVQRLEEIKVRVLADPAIETYLEQTWDTLYGHLATDPQAVNEVVHHAVLGLSQRLETDPAMRDSVNRWLRDAAERLLVPRREFIGSLIADLVMRWRTDALVDRLESHVGRDLQYIRINGTVVGGLTGLALYFVTNAWRG